MVERNKILFFVDRKSFPVKCGELFDFISIVEKENEVELSEVESPTMFFKQAMERTNDYELVIPVTRNFFVRDKLRMEGVNLVVCL